MSESNAPETTVNRFFRKRRRLSDGPNNAEPEITQTHLDFNRLLECDFWLALTRAGVK